MRRIDSGLSLLDQHRLGEVGQRRALVLDLMERRRPVVDAAALKFMTVEFLSGADFVIRDDGVLRLTPQLARWIYQLFDELRIRPVAGLPLTEQVASHLQPVP